MSTERHHQMVPVCAGCGTEEPDLIEHELDGHIIQHPEGESLCGPLHWEPAGVEALIEQGEPQ